MLTQLVGIDTTVVCRLGFLAKQEIFLRFWDCVEVVDCTVLLKLLEA